MAPYSFDPSWEGERNRMVVAEGALDPITIRQLKSIGVDEGWRCLEVGAGAGSITRWLSRRVGPSGRVLATDIDTRFVEALAEERAEADRAGPGESGLEVRRHDITVDWAPEGGFDVAHARLVLQHLADRPRAVANMAAAVVPGGWILVEELDFISSSAATPYGARIFARVEKAIHRLLGVNGFDPACGRHLAGILEGAGLDDVEARGGLSVVAGGAPYTVWYRQSIEALRPRLVSSGLVSHREVDRVTDLLADPGFSLMTPVLISARGRRPTTVG